MQKNKNRIGYKKTRIGWMPDTWDIASGEEVASKVTKGSSPKWQGFNYQSSGVLFVTSENVRDGYLDVTSPKYLPPEFSLKQKNSILQDDDILINIVGASIGRSCKFVGVTSPANVNQAVCVFRSKPEVSSDFILATFQSSKGIDRLLSSQVESARPNVSLSDIRKFDITLPPFAEQKAIADVLNSWDHGIRQLEAKLATKQKIKKGLMQELLSGQRRVAGFGPDLKVQEGACSIPEGWKSVKLANIVDLQYGKDWKTVVDPSGQFNVFGTGGLMGKSTRALFSAPAIILGRKGTIDKPFYVTAPFWAVDTTFVIHPRGQNILKFLYFKFLTINWKNYSEASGVPSLSRPTLQQIKVILPPVEEQQAIVKILNAADRELDALERKLSNWKAQKKYLLNNLVDGTIRLPQFINAETC
jgi:type I restriction enzyme S subunit